MAIATEKLETRQIISKYLIVLSVFAALMCGIRLYQTQAKYHSYSDQIQSWQVQIQKGQIKAMSQEDIRRSFAGEIFEEVLFLVIGLGCFVVGSSVVVYGLIKKILHSNHFLSQSLDAMTHPVYVLNAATDALVMSNQAASAGQRSVSDKCDLICRQNDLVCDPQIQRCILDQVRTEGKPAVLEKQYLDPDGQTYIIEIHANPIYDASGSLSHILCYTLDVTEQKKTEEELRKRRENLQAVFELAPVGMLLIDESLKIQLVNQACTHLVGKDIEEVVGKLPGNALQCLTAMESPGGCGTGAACRGCNLRDVFNRVFGENVSVQRKETEMEFLLQEQQVKLHFEISALPLILDGKRYAVAVLNNITDRKRTEEQLCLAREQSDHARRETEQLNKRLDAAAQHANKLAQEAMSANEAKSSFLAAMSHEIRTPMNAILGFSELLSEEKLEDQQRSYVNLIRSSGVTLLGLINDILDLSKIEAGKLSIEKTDAQLDVILEEMESMFRPMASKKGIELAVLQCDELPRVIQTDPMRLRQCLINLINNAIKFTSEGHVYLNVSAHRKKDKYLIQFDVEDTGIGIPADKQQTIFEAFVQAESSTAQKFGGTGLGLAITQKLSVMLGGNVTVFSQPGFGSIFTLTIDVTSTQQSSMWNKYDNAEAIHRNPKPQKAEVQVESASILLAEDNPVNQQLMKALLTKMGHQIAIAENGQLAVEMAEKAVFDIILMDVQMPVLGGLEATRAIRAKGIATPIVAVTANALKGDSDQCFAAGCDDYLSKPIDKKRLVDMLNRYLTKSSTTPLG